MPHFSLLLTSKVFIVHLNSKSISKNKNKYMKTTFFFFFVLFSYFETLTDFKNTSNTDNKTKKLKDESGIL